MSSDSGAEVAQRVDSLVELLDDVAKVDAAALIRAEPHLAPRRPDRHVAVRRGGDGRPAALRPEPDERTAVLRRKPPPF